MINTDNLCTEMYSIFLLVSTWVYCTPASIASISNSIPERDVQELGIIYDTTPVCPYVYQKACTAEFLESLRKVRKTVKILRRECEESITEAKESCAKQIRTIFNDCTGSSYHIIVTQFYSYSQQPEIDEAIACIVRECLSVCSTVLEKFTVAPAERMLEEIQAATVCPRSKRLLTILVKSMLTHGKAGLETLKSTTTREVIGDLSSKWASTENPVDTSDVPTNCVAKYLFEIEERVSARVDLVADYLGRTFMRDTREALAGICLLSVSLKIKELDREQRRYLNRVKRIITRHKKYLGREFADVYLGLYRVCIECTADAHGTGNNFGERVNEVTQLIRHQNFYESNYVFFEVLLGSVCGFLKLSNKESSSAIFDLIASPMSRIDPTTSNPILVFVLSHYLDSILRSLVKWKVEEFEDGSPIWIFSELRDLGFALSMRYPGLIEAAGTQQSSGQSSILCRSRDSYAKFQAIYRN